MKSKIFSPTSEPRLRVGLRDATREEFSQAVRQQLQREPISMLVDTDVLAFFKAKAGDDYRELMNETLREAMNQEPLESRIRRVVREELEAAGNH